MMKTTTLVLLSALTLLIALAGCPMSDDVNDSSSYAINPLTAETKAFDSKEDIPLGWAACVKKNDCPEPLPCVEIPEWACLLRVSCQPSYIAIQANPPECEEAESPPEFCDGTLFTGCLESSNACELQDCGSATAAPTHVCPDGSLGGSTGRCVLGDNEICGWEIRQCPDPCSDTLPECDLLCPAGTGNPTDECGRVHTCECVTDDCGEVPVCQFLCPPGTHNPVDEFGCLHTCECAPDSTECTPEECGPAPGCSAYTCADGSTGGCTGLCYRLADGGCGWEIRECPTDELKWYMTCGDPVCGPQGHRDSSLPTCTTETVGDFCTPEGASCDPINECNSHLICADSDPRLAEGGCPISRREFKQDIRYLSPEDRASYAEEIMAVRLATYRYRAVPERVRLGFIIEDQEPSASIDSGRDMVDLYGYTSMVVAALQAQAEEMAALRREIEELRAQLKSDAAVCR